MNCPLCAGKDIKKIKKIDNKKLISAYKKLTGNNFSYLFSENIILYKCKSCKLKFYYPYVTGDEKFYNALQKFDWYYLDNKYEYTFASKYIEEGDRVLDVGSGKGAFSNYLPNGASYVGLDLSKNAKELGKLNNIYIENEDIITHSEKYINYYDVVVSFQVIEHVSEPARLLEGKIRSLKKNGTLIIAVPSEDSFIKYDDNSILNMPPHHISRWSDDTLRYIAKLYGLELECINHEKVQEIHKVWYLKVLIMNSISRSKLSNIYFFKSFLHHKITGLLSKFLINGLSDELLPNGHTVIAVYKKI